MEPQRLGERQRNKVSAMAQCVHIGVGIIMVVLNYCCYGDHYENTFCISLSTVHPKLQEEGFPINYIPCLLTSLGLLVVLDDFMHYLLESCLAPS